MKFDVVFQYKARIVRPRKRNPEDCVFRGKCAVDIPVVEAGDAPVAATYPKPGVGENRGQLTELRWRDGSLWRREDDDPDCLKRGPWTVDNMREMLEDPFLYAGLSKRLRERYDGDAGFIDETPLSKIEVSDFHKVRSEVEVAARNLMVLDGGVWRKTPEPLLKENFYTDRRITSWSISIDDERKGQPGLYDIARLSDYEKMNEKIRNGRKRVAERNDGDRYEFEEVSGIDIRIPEAFVYPVDENILFARTKTLLDDMEKRIATRDVPFFAAFANLRDFVAGNAMPVKRVDKVPEGLDIDGLVGVVRGAAEAYREYDPKEGESMTKECLDAVDAVQAKRLANDPDIGAISL
jgi:hypothetical protein